MLAALELVATACAAIFAGAALYINVAEHPARLRLETRAAVLQWKPSYARATRMQAPLALISFASGVGAWLLGGGSLWFTAAVLIAAVVPVTLGVILPVNRSLLAPDRDLESAETRALLERWGRLHGVRTALSLAATGLYLWLLVSK